MSEKEELKKFLVITREYLNNYHKLLPEEGATKADWFSDFERLSEFLDPEEREVVAAAYDILSKSESLYHRSIERLIEVCESFEEFLTYRKEDKE